MISFSPAKMIYSSYLRRLKGVFVIRINLSQLFLNQEDYYRQFNWEVFKKDLEFRLNDLTSSSYDSFEIAFIKELNKDKLTVKDVADMINSECCVPCNFLKSVNFC